MIDLLTRKIQPLGLINELQEKNTLGISNTILYKVIQSVTYYS